MRYGAENVLQISPEDWSPARATAVPGLEIDFGGKIRSSPPIGPEWRSGEEAGLRSRS